MKKIQLQGDPNMYYLSMVQIGFTPETFRFMLVTGKQARQFETTPEHAKRIKMVLDKKIEEYEEANKKIEAGAPPNEDDGKTTEKPSIGFSNEEE